MFGLLAAWTTLEKTPKGVPDSGMEAEFILTRNHPSKVRNLNLAEAIRDFATENRKKINAVIEEAFAEYLARRTVDRQG
jgi:hypothetical protein